MALLAVTEAIEKLPTDNPRDDENLSDSDELDDQTYFCVEDTFLSKDINVTVEGVGNITFPISEDTVNSLIKISSKAKFGRGEDTILDTSVRDTQMIPASKLKVEINEETLKNTLERVALGLKVDENCSLVPHLFNMLIYGPGQFFDLHKDSEKEKNMVASLVIVLPCSHKGGDLIVKHQNKQHVFFGSRNPDFIKCVMFYSDCQHEIKKVTEGFRIALTYNVVLLSPEIVSSTNVNQDLHDAVSSYFNGATKPKRLIYYLNHNYSEHSLKWNLLKGTDRKEALALFAVAKQQGRVPCLALLDYSETYDVEDADYDDLIDDHTELVYWVDEHNIKFKEKNFNHVSEKEICYTIKTSDLLEPYKTEESGPTGNEGETKDFWYKRACVVLWSEKHNFAHGFKSRLYELHGFLKEKGNEVVLLDEINKIGPDFFQKSLWTEQVVIEMLLDIVLYLNDTAIAVSILSKIPSDVLSHNRIDRLVQIENQYDDDTWTRIVELWKKNFNWYSIVENSYSTIKKYLKVSNKPTTIGYELLKETVDNYIRLNNYGSKHYVYGTVNNSQTDRLVDIFQVCFDFESWDLVDKLINFSLNTSNVHNLRSLASLLCKLQVLLSPSQFLYCKSFRESVLSAINNQLSQVTLCANDWHWPLTISCRCVYCSKVQEFFQSKSANRVVIPAAKDYRRHVYSHLNPLKDQPVKFYTERSGSPFKIIIEKEPKLLLDRQIFFNGLKSSKESLEELVFQEVILPSDDISITDIHKGMSSNTSPSMQLTEEENALVVTGFECSELPIKRQKRS